MLPIKDKGIYRCRPLFFLDSTIVKQINCLRSDLSDSLPRATHESVRSAMASPGTCLLVAQDPADRIVGMVTVSVRRDDIFKGPQATIQNLVVAGDSQGKGIAKSLMRLAITWAEDKGAVEVRLHSNSTREEAHELYGKLGFTEYQTCHFRLPLT